MGVLKMNFREELIKSIQTIINNNLDCYKTDRTFISVVKEVTPKGYVVLDETACERTVKCAIPNVELKAGKNVWVKIPRGNLNQMHICGIM